MMNKSKDQIRNLPRIQSQTRVNTAFQRKQSRDTFDKKTEPNQRQLKKTHSTNACKFVKYQNAGQLYTKKIAQLKGKRGELDYHIKMVEHQIKQFKKNALGYQTKAETFKQQPQKTNFITQIANYTSQSKITVNSTYKIPTDEKSLTNQLKSTQSKLQILRKKIDEQRQRNTKIQKQINIIRKQIHTYKNLNQTMINQLEKTNNQYQKQNQYLKSIEQEICNKNILVHKVKVNNQHKKAEMIRQYDQILRELEKQVANGNNNGNNNGKGEGKQQMQVLYLTQYNNKNIVKPQQKQANETHTTIKTKKYTQIPQKQQKSKSFNNSLHSHHLHSNIPLNPNPHPNITPSSSSPNTTIQSLKHKINQYQSQLTQIYTKTNTKNTYETLQKFSIKYQQNYHIFQYINLLNEELFGLENQRKLLGDRRDMLMRDIHEDNDQDNSKDEQRQNYDGKGKNYYNNYNNQGKDGKQNQIFNIKCTLNSIALQKSKLSNLNEKYEKIFVQIKQVIRQFYQKLQINTKYCKNNNLDIKNINDQNILQFLFQIRNRCNELDHKFQSQSQQPSNNLNLNLNFNGNINNMNTNSNNNNNNNEMNLSQILQTIKKQNNYQNNNNSNNHNNHNKSTNAYSININSNNNNNNNNNSEGKNQKLMTREQFIKAREYLMKKKSHSNTNTNTNTNRRPLSKR